MADSAPLMTVPGQFGVGATGAATYSIPIAAPPGTAGMVPAVSLDYSSQGTDGIVGWQWSLGGLPAITRCARAIQEDSVHGGINYDSNDRFCLGGQRLMVISGTYGANASEYRTEIDTFNKIVAYGTAGSGPSYFKLWTKSGQVLEFGNTTDSKILAVGKATVRAWAVDKIADTKGNYLTVTYTNDTTYGQYYPTRIDYTGNAGAGLSPYNSIQFTYNTTRADVAPTYQAGSLIETTVLLTHVKTYQGANLVYDYQLAYRAGTSTLHSRLTSVTLCDAGSNCLAPTSFTWQGGSGLPAMSSTSSSLAQGLQILPGDFNGDGITDAIVKNSPNTSCPSGGIISTGSTSGTFTAANMTFGYPYWPAPNHTVMAYNSIACYYKVQGGVPADFDGDGYTDDLMQELYWYYEAGPGEWFYTLTTIPLENNESGALNDVHTNTAGPQFSIIGDFNGDGRTDGYYQSDTTGYGYAYMSNGDGTFTVDAGEAGLDVSSTVYPGDFDGDGCTDMLSQGGANKIVYFCHPATSSVSVTNWSGSAIYPGDYNGDGKTDILVVGGSGATIYLSTGTGFSSGHAVSGSSGWSSYGIVAGDWNGDGKTDVALISHTSGTPHAIYLSTGTDFAAATTISNSATDATAVAADWNSDGASDIWLQKSSGDVEYTFAYVPETVTAVLNGVGATTTITYDRLNKNGAFYAKNPQTYPYVALDGAYYVVSQVDTSNTLGGNFTQTYAYAGAFGNAGSFQYMTAQGFSNLGFRGVSAAHGAGAVLGFAQIKATDSQTGVVTTVNYGTSVPYLGVVTSQTVVHGAVTLASVTNTLENVALGGGRYFVGVHQAVTAGNDLNGAALPTTTTTYTYDCDSTTACYGNTTVAAAAVSDGSSSTVTNTFATADTTNWLVNLVTGRTVRNIVGASDLTRTTAYAYASGTNIATQSIAEPSDCEHKLQIDVTLDGYGNGTATQASGAGCSGDGYRSAIATRTAYAGFDAAGAFQTSATDPLSHGESFAYSAAFGAPTSHTDIDGRATGWSYDTLGRLTLAIRPDGTRTAVSYAYCAGVNGGAASCPTYGAYLKQTEAFASDGVTQIGPVATAYYDALGRVIAQDVQGYGGGASRIATVYDANGRVYETSRPYFVSGGTPKWTVDTYDDLGRLTRQDLPNGGYATVAYNGLTVSTANDQGQTTAVTRNAQGLNASVTDALGHTTSYAYDAFGDLLTVTDPSGNVIANSFDIRGNKTASADPDMGSWSYVPDVLGEIRSQTDARSQTTTLSYDLLGRVLERNEAGSYTDWVYDGAVHGVGMVQASCTSASSNPSCASATTAKTFTYDGLGRPTGTTIAVGGTNYAYATAYNATNGAVDTVSYPSGLVVKDLYNAYGYLCRVTDNGGSHTCATGSDSHVLWTLSGADAELHPTVQTAGNAAFSTTQTYDANTGLLTNVRAGASDAVAAFDYGYDTLGNLTYRSDNHQGIFEKFCYDALNRLTNAATGSSGPASCTSGAITKSVGYDALGNITSKSDVGTYSYPAAGTAHPHAVSSIAGTVNGVTNPGYTYDADGNMTAGAGRTVTYTAFNMAASIVQGSTADCLTYDSDHARVAMAVYAGTACGGTLSSTTTYLNDPASGAMSEQLVAGGTTTWHDYLKVGGAILGERFYTVGGATSWKYFVLDHLGSVAVMTDDAGGVAERLSYDAWGRRRNSDGTDNAACSITSTTTRGYTGHEMLDSICEINANARIYDPTLGRFMSPDSTIPDPFNGQSFNRYSYVMNNPLSHYDPSGYAPQTRTVITNCEKDVCTGSKVPGGCGGCYIGFGAQFLAFTSGASGAGLGDAWTGSSTGGVWVETSETLVGTPIETVVVTCCFWVSFNFESFNQFGLANYGASNRDPTPIGGGDTNGGTYFSNDNSTVGYAIKQYERAFGPFDPRGPNSHIYSVGPIQVCNNGPSCAMNAALHCNVPTGCSSTAVKTGDVMFAGPGWVSVNVDMANHDITNITTMAHGLYPGVVSIDVIQNGNTGSVIFTGVGTGMMGQTNDYYAPDVWGYTASQMSAWAASHH
ncbi:MAG: FG-GAP-like repeat-containing protein [Rhizomicrobium sp.]